MSIAKLTGRNGQPRNGVLVQATSDRGHVTSFEGAETSPQVEVELSGAFNGVWISTAAYSWADAKTVRATVLVEGEDLRKLARQLKRYAKSIEARTDGI